jgi:hypothetical protein
MTLGVGGGGEERLEMTGEEIVAAERERVM